ncbi:MAG: hypothetical protein M1337_05260, partial [Actinobacteria bacterium]|nr:hypothetical protein [Actinomycetota bacterium]
MTLRRRTQLLVGLSLLAGLSVLYVSSEFWFSRSFQRAEGTEQREAMQRVLNAISRDQRELDSDAVDYAMWNDTYEFVVAPDPRYVDNNLNDSFFTAFRLDAALMIRSDGMVVWSRAFNSETKALAALPADLERDLVAQQFVRLQDPEHGVSGLLFLRNEPMLVAARPIVTSDGEGPVRGVFIMVRYLNAAYMQQLSDLTRLEVRLTPLPKALPESDTGSFLASSKSLTSAVVRPWGEDMVTGYAAVNDLHARPLGLLEVTSKRLIVAEGRGALRGTLVIFAGVALVLGVLIHRVLERSVLSPLSSLQGEVRGLRAGTGRRVALKGSSPREIQELGQIINTSI